MTSRQPCWKGKQRNGGHIGGVKYSFGDETIFMQIPPFVSLCKHGFWSHEGTHSLLALGIMDYHTFAIECRDGIIVCWCAARAAVCYL